MTRPIQRPILNESHPCACDFCTGKKDWNDNWCPWCGKVQMEPPKWWENMDMCDECEASEDVKPPASG